MSNQPLFEMPTDVTPDNLEEVLQQAINLEIATIPTYLYTYYSIKRSWNPDKPSRPDNLDGPPIDLSSASGLRDYISKHGTGVTAEQAQEMAVDVQVYANEAAALILSVAMEEMLHMSLSSNVKQSLFGPPALYDNIPAFPAYLPGHEPYFPINEAKFSQDQLKTFLKIESPDAFTGSHAKGGKDAVRYDTIGDLYRAMEDCIENNFFRDDLYNKERPQLLPFREYYFQNTINTVYYNRDHQPEFPGADDSGDLVHVVNLESALLAMREVVEQGEGHKGGDRLTEDGEPKCPDINWDNPAEINPLDFDDGEGKELSHFARFLKLYCQGAHLIEKFNKAGLDFESFFVYDLPENPKTSDYAEHDVVAVSNLINGLYTYMFLMVEACYYNTDPAQFEVFMLGVHKNMIWALSSMCNSEVQKTVTINGKTCNFGPTFEKIDFGASSESPKQQLADLATAAGDSWDWVMDYIRDFPDVSINHEVKTNPLLTSVTPPPKPASAPDANATKQRIPPLELHACMGLNACKGHDYFGTNDCAGMGYCATQHHSCHTLNDCRGQGGCGLFGSTEEQCHPGENDCAFQGSCGTPIPAFRFITQGPNKGRSVWQIARARFEERMQKANRSAGPSPMQNGPTLEWLESTFNENGSGSCGQSGYKFCSFVSPQQGQERHDEFVAKSAQELPQSLENCDGKQG